MEFMQIIVGNMKNFTYIVGDSKTRNGFIIDPSYDIDKVITAVRKLDLNIKYIFNTHSHWDHTIGNKEAVQRTGGQICAHESAPTNKDRSLKDKEVIKLDSLTIRIMHTPGHTPDGICYLLSDKTDTKKNYLFTGDTLFVGGCGRTDLPGGSNEDMYNSLVKIMREMPDKLIVYPGHDYGPTKRSKMGIEKENNYTLEERTKDEFLKFMLN